MIFLSDTFDLHMLVNDCVGMVIKEVKETQVKELLSNTTIVFKSAVNQATAEMLSQRLQVPVTTNCTHDECRLYEGDLLVVALADEELQKVRYFMLEII